MKNFKKVLALALAFAMVLSTMTTAFAATANADKAQVLYDLDLFDGKSADEYMPALEDAATAPEALKLIGTALGWTVDADATTTFEDVPAWAVPWVAKAVELGITNGVSDTEFGSDVIDGKRVVTWFLRALGYDMDEAWNDTETLATTAGLTIPTATLRDDVVGVIYQGLMTTPVGADATLIETIVLDDAAKTAIAEEAGLVDASLAIEAAAAVGVKAVEVKLNKAVDTATTTVKVKKGAAIYGTAATWNDAKNTATVATVINLVAGDYTIEVTTADETLTETITVVAEAAATIEVTTTEVEDATAAAQVKFVVKNQYGEDMGKKADDANITSSAYNVTQSAAVTVVEPNEAYFTIDTTAGGVDAFKTGDVIRLTVTYLGMTTQANVTVIDKAAGSTIQLGATKLVATDDTMLNVGDAEVYMAYTLLDQYGTAVKLSDVGLGAFVGGSKTLGDVQIITSDATIIDEVGVKTVDDVSYLWFSVAKEGTAVITAVVNSTGSVSNASVVVNKDSAPDAVAISAPTMLVASMDDSFKLPMTITDQYGAVLTSKGSLTVAWKTPGDLDKDANDDDSVQNSALSLSDTDKVTEVVVDLTKLDAGDVDETKSVTIEVKSGTTVIGSVTFDVEPEAKAQEITKVDVVTIIEDEATLTVTKDDISVLDQYGRAFPADGFTIAEKAATALFDTASPAVQAKDPGTATFTVTVGTATKDIDLTAIASAGVENYTIATIGDVYAKGAGNDVYDVAVKLNGVDANGKSVVLVSADPDFITSSDEAIATVDNNTEIDGIKAGTVTISAWKGGKVVATATVTVTEAAPVPTTVTWDAAAITEGTNLDTLVTVKDQYGQVITPTLYFSGTNVNTDGTLKNLTTAANGAQDITVVTLNGVSATKSVTLTFID